MLDSSVSDGNTIVLPDGRKLGYSDWGPLNGKVVLFFPGIPCSRFFRFGSKELLEELNVRMFVLERPGYGLSDIKANRNILDWAADVNDFLEILDIEKANIVGYSGGGPFALACTYALFERINNTAIVSGCDPHFQYEVFINHSEKIKEFASLVKSDPEAALRIAMDLSINPKKITEELIGAASLRDQEIFSYPEINSMFLANFIEGTRSNLLGFEYAHELLLLFKPWDFPYDEINKEIHLWYGMHDKNEFHSPTHGKYSSEKLPNSKLHLYEDEGTSILWAKSREILQSVLNNVI